MAPRTIIIVLAACISGCAVRYVPLAGEGVLLGASRASARNEKLNVTVTHERLAGGGQTLGTRLTVFNVAVRNLSTEPVKLTADDFLLFDHAGTQYSTVSSQELAGASADCSYRPATGIGFGWHGGGYSVFGARWGQDFGCDTQFGQEVVSRSFLPAAPLQPGAKMTGLIYFRGDVGDAERLRFEVHSPPNAKPLSFTFGKEK